MKKRIGWWAALLAGTALLSSCATLSEDECLVGDWRQIGFTDGASGKPADILRNHGEACARFGVGTDYELWRAGYEAGLDIFCTPETALAIGARGESYDGVCQGDRAALFAEAYADGRLLHDALSDLAAEERILREIERDIEALRDERAEARARAGDAALTKAERDAAEREIRRLNRSLDRTKDELDEASFDVSEARNDAAALRDQLLFRYPGAELASIGGF